tara:strand:- start:2662 stop:2895 length:234 start_codon:yes stop_codon:yes gene_type:complete
MDIGRLENNALEKAVELIHKTISMVVNQSSIALTFEGPDEIEDLWNAWELIQTFGDLHDNEGMFTEFASIYNSDRGY